MRQASVDCSPPVGAIDAPTPERVTERERQRQRQGETERETARDTDRQRQRQTETETERQTERQRERDRERESLRQAAVDCSPPASLGRPNYRTRSRLFRQREAMLVRVYLCGERGREKESQRQ